MCEQRMRIITTALCGTFEDLQGSGWQQIIALALLGRLVVVGRH